MTDYFVYLLECSDGTLYCGIATDVARRIDEHNAATGRGAKYVRGRTPVRLIAASEPLTKPDALRLEHAVKQLKKDAKLALASTWLERK